MMITRSASKNRRISAAFIVAPQPPGFGPCGTFWLNLARRRLKPIMRVSAGQRSNPRADEGCREIHNRNFFAGGYEPMPNVTYDNIEPNIAEVDVDGATVNVKWKCPVSGRVVCESAANMAPV